MTTRIPEFPSPSIYQNQMFSPSIQVAAKILTRIITCCDCGYGRPSGRPRVSQRRTVQVRLRSNTLWLPGTRRKRLRCAWHAHLHGLATVIHETSGLRLKVEVPSIPRAATIRNPAKPFVSGYRISPAAGGLVRYDDCFRLRTFFGIQHTTSLRISVFTPLK